MNITLEGIYDTVLGGFQCMRGYAYLWQIHALSTPNEAFQRPLIKTHGEEIERFLNDEEYLFFPEVILSCPLRYDYSKRSADSGINPMRLIQDNDSFTSNVNELRIKFPTKQKPQKISLELDDGQPSEMLLSRIDGNHRISAYELKPEVFGQLQVPFCIIFLEQDDERIEKVIFNNINFKQIPLLPEQSLKVILDTFDDTELQADRFGWPYWYTKQLIECVNNGLFLHTPFLIKKDGEYHDECRTVIFDLCKFLQQEEKLSAEESGLAAFKDAIQKIDISLEGRKVSQGLFIASVYINLTDPNRCPEFLNWLSINSLDEIKEVSPKSLIEIFYKVFEKNRKQIFISMPFGEDNTEDHYAHIAEAINDINTEYNLDIKFKAIRVDKTEKPGTFQITDEILEFINTSGLLIADLSYGNPNVYHEVGYAMGLAKERGLENNIILILRENLPEQNSVVEFNLTGFSQLRFTQTNILKTEIKQRIKTFYELADR
jgi:hypothetical protein